MLRLAVIPRLMFPSLMFTRLIWFGLWTCLGIFAVPVSAQDPAVSVEKVYSGPQIGESISPFTVTGVYGDLAGKSIDPVDRFGDRPTLWIFVHQVTRPGMALTRGLTSYAKSLAGDQVGANADDQVSAAIIWLDDDQAAAQAFLVRAAKSLNFLVPVGVSVDGGEGPGALGLNRNVELTILVTQGKQVEANFALVQPSVSEAVTIAAALAKVAKKEPPTQDALMAMAYPGQAGRNADRMRMRGKRPNETKPDETKKPDPRR